MIGKLSGLLAQGFAFFRQNDLRTVISAVLSRDSHPLLQFAKYVVCGGVAFMTHQVVALTLGIFVFHDRAYELDILPTQGGVELPQSGERQVIIGSSQEQLSLRVFDAEGAMVVDGRQSTFTGKEYATDELQQQLKEHRKDPEASSFKAKANMIKQVTEITGYDPDVERKRNSFINNTIAFAIATVVAYILNVAFVFTSGRHSKQKEIFLFVAVSMVSYVGGMVAVDFVFRFLGDIEALASVSRFLSVIANLGFAVTSAMVNYVCRKFIIFQK